MGSSIRSTTGLQRADAAPTPMAAPAAHTETGRSDLETSDRSFRKRRDCTMGQKAVKRRCLIQRLNRDHSPDPISAPALSSLSLSPSLSLPRTLKTPAHPSFQPSHQHPCACPLHSPSRFRRISSSADRARYVARWCCKRTVDKWRS